MMIYAKKKTKQKKGRKKETDISINSVADAVSPTYTKSLPICVYLKAEKAPRVFPFPVQCIYSNAF
jgi:hypothetical protein